MSSLHPIKYVCLSLFIATATHAQCVKHPALPPSAARNSSQQQQDLPAKAQLSKGNPRSSKRSNSHIDKNKPTHRRCILPANSPPSSLKAGVLALRRCTKIYLALV